ncbi:MAG: FAD:protein FMN transferase [Deltaproteobacteria bacterium]|nr:FAD:protein FMN transferase [Deltaproteobacteria bacterium]
MFHTMKIIPRCLSIRHINTLCIVIMTLFYSLCITSNCIGEVFRKDISLMGTDVEIIAAAKDNRIFTAAFDAAVMEMKRIEGEMSEWKQETLISEINMMAGNKPVKVSDELFNVISAAQKIADISDGAFDISWACMRGLWNFTDGKNIVPAREEIEQRLKFVNYRDIMLDENKKTVFLKRKGMAIGLGGIAKGYAVDKAMQVLVSHGIKDAVIKAGGDTRVQGAKQGEAWEIGIKHPRDKARHFLTLELSNISISTSGDYERFFIKDNVLYHHIMDPKTGYPAKHSQSVTILAPDTMTSDALSTAVFVLGHVKGMELIKKLPGIEGIIIDSTGKAHYSNGFEKSGLTKK